MNPDEYTIEERFLEVGQGHSLYVHVWGNPKAAKTILFLHGGPGVGVKDSYKATFDPKLHKVVFFDQRGSGKSLPKASTKDNTTEHMIADIEKLADTLRLDRFIITGGSWGSCLALAYALAHPKRVEAMVLRGIFTGSKAEIDWLDKGYYKTFFPDVWESYMNLTPAAYADDPTAYHVKRILGRDEKASRESAYIYSNVEGALLNLDDRYTPDDPQEFDPTIAILEAHYLSNGCFLPERHILNNAHKLTMPVWLIQGRYDMVCPPSTAYELSTKLPNGRLTWTVAGHGNDRANYDVNRTILIQMAEE